MRFRLIHPSVMLTAIRGAKPYKTPIPLLESFEFSGNWPGTIANVLYYSTFVFTGSNLLEESFETEEGW